MGSIGQAVSLMKRLFTHPVVPWGFPFVEEPSSLGTDATDAQDGFSQWLSSTMSMSYGFSRVTTKEEADALSRSATKPSGVSFTTAQPRPLAQACVSEMGNAETESKRKSALARQTGAHFPFCNFACPLSKGRAGMISPHILSWSVWCNKLCQI